MTYKDDYSIPQEVLEQICEEGFDALLWLVFRLRLISAFQSRKREWTWGRMMK